MDQEQSLISDQEIDVIVKRIFPTLEVNIGQGVGAITADIRATLAEKFATLAKTIPKLENFEAQRTWVLRAVEAADPNIVTTVVKESVTRLYDKQSHEDYKEFMKGKHWEGDRPEAVELEPFLAPAPVGSNKKGSLLQRWNALKNLGIIDKNNSFRTEVIVKRIRHAEPPKKVIGLTYDLRLILEGGNEVNAQDYTDQLEGRYRPGVDKPRPPASDYRIDKRAKRPRRAGNARA